MKQEYKEFGYYLKLRLENWFKLRLNDDQYKQVTVVLKQVKKLLLRTYYENRYLLVKQAQIKSINGKSNRLITKIILVVVLLLLTKRFKWMFLVDLVVIISVLTYRHYKCCRDASYCIVQLLDDHLSNKNAKNRYYQYPLREFDVLLELYQCLNGAQQGILFDDFILLSNLKITQEAGFSAVLNIDISLKYQQAKVVNLDDYMLKELRILPDFKTGQYIYNERLKQDVLSIIKRQPLKETVNKMLLSGNYKVYPELLELAVQDEKSAVLKQQRDYVDKNHLPDKIWSIWKYFAQNSDSLGFSYWDNNSNSVTGSSSYINMRMRLIGNTTYSDAKKKVDLVAKNLRCDVMTKAIASDHGSFQMTFVLGQIVPPVTTNIKTIKEYANKGKLKLGNSRTGKYVVDLPRGDDLTAILCGAQSRSGKSTMITQVILSMLYLKTNKRFDYSDVYIATVKDEDYISNGFKQSGMLVKSEVHEIYVMLQHIDEQATKRKQLFINNGVKNIKEYNHKNPDHTLGKLLLVFDEYANTLAAAEGERVEIDGKKIKLRDAIERIMVKISQEHGSRGVSVIVITQQFSKGEVGRLFDTTNIQVLGYARSNVWNSIDNSQEMSKYLESKSEQRRGLFFVNAPDLKTDNPQISFNSGYTEVRTANIDTQEVHDNFDRKFNTASNYGEQNTSVAGEVLLEPIELGKLIKINNTRE
ncbi:hypothetical protein [Lactiplantibacillus herbarum]|uniref:hypothetical protein n=1 Tax=Lactiplantibacillus herbarum TaxID=1670446 RepID=UPI00064EFD94|nr:hypothetical protein [Lactiplantibacillus herbarum]